MLYWGPKGLSDWTKGYEMYDYRFDDPSEVLSLLLKICLNIKTDEKEPLTFLGCWSTNNIHPGEKYLFIKTSMGFQIKATRLLCGIFRRPSLTNGSKLQCSHLCFMDPTCINPKHLFPESRKVKNDRQRCTNGCANYCPHIPKCIWTGIDGKLLLHRNDPYDIYSKEDCDCIVNCYSFNK